MGEVLNHNRSVVDSDDAEGVNGLPPVGEDGNVILDVDGVPSSVSEETPADEARNRETATDSAAENRSTAENPTGLPDSANVPAAPGAETADQ